MLNKMYDAMDAACTKASEVTGVYVKFPRPSKRAFQISAVTNGLVGTGCVLFGVLSQYKWPIVLGSLGLASSMIISSKARSLKQ